MQMICDQASNRELVKTFSKLTPETIIGGDFPSLAVLRRNYNEETIENALSLLIVEASEYFGEGFSTKQAFNLSSEILSNYYYLSLEDCILVLNRLKRTTIYGKLTLNHVLSLFDAYDSERTQIVNDNNYNQHLSYKEERKTGSWKDTIRVIKDAHKKKK